MSATIEIEGNVARIVLRGKLDYSTQNEIHISIDEALAVGHASEIEVDLAGVTFMDSSVIRALLALQTLAAKDGKSVVLINCSDVIRQIFTVGGFDRILTIHP